MQTTEVNCWIQSGEENGLVGGTKSKQHREVSAPGQGLHLTY